MQTKNKITSAAINKPTKITNNPTIKKKAMSTKISNV